MKFVNFVVIFLAAGVLIAAGQTNLSTNGVSALLALVNTNQTPAATNKATAPKPAAQGPTAINAAGPMDVDWDNHLVIFRNNVCVTNVQMKMTCEWLTANLPQGKEHMTNIVAQTNVVADFIDEQGRKAHATGSKAVYFYHVENGVTNETITLTGTPEERPKLYREQDSLTGDSITWNFVDRRLHVEHPYGIGWPETNKAPAVTNSPLLKTNQVAGTNG